MVSDGAKTGVRELVKVIISKDAMTASMLLRQAPSGEPEATLADVRAALAEHGVEFGILEDVIAKAITDRAFNTPIKAAVGTRPKRGKCAEITHHFNTSEKLSPTEGEDGRIDYHNINFIQNVSADDLLATKIPPTEGIPGRTVLGKQLAGPPGRDVQFSNGVNTVISSDGTELRASKSGVIVFLHGKVSVNDVLLIPGDVDFNVGNLDARGSLKIGGTIKAGFEVVADGDIEIGGNVEDATIRSKGNILLKGGFFGNGQGIMQAVGDITLKYAEGQKIVSGGDICIGGELINCQVTAKGVVRVVGRRGKIIGGVTRAGKEIRTSVAGTDTGTRTDLHVAYDAALMKEYHAIAKELERLLEDKARVKEALYGLYRLQMNGKLPPDKEQALVKLKQFHIELPANLEALQGRKGEIESKLSENEDAIIVVNEKLHSGVVTHFGIVYREIMEDSGHCRISLEGNQILMSALNPC